MNRSRYDDDDDDTIYKVVTREDAVNRQIYSIWPADRENPKGWHDVGYQGSKQEYQDLIEGI